MAKKKKRKTVQMPTPEKYIEQLIKDIRKATFNIRPPRELWADADPDDEGVVEDLAYAEEFIYGEKEPVEKITGIKVGSLPPEERLTTKQQEVLAIELEKLLNYFNFRFEFPENLPVHMRYPWLRNFWQEERVALSFGESYVGLCDYDEENCPFPGYCTGCADFAKEEEEGIKADDSDFDVDELLLSPEEMEAWAESQGIEKAEPDSDLPFGTDDEDYVEDITGLYDDEGNKIDPDSIPVPGLCVICKKYDSNDWEEHLLCMMNRNAQKNKPRFQCGAFKKM
ncbi:MAG: hypothetical protein ACOC1D_03270 [Prolixibacteraceae bacterium]